MDKISHLSSLTGFDEDLLKDLLEKDAGLAQIVGKSLGSISAGARNMSARSFNTRTAIKRGWQGFAQEVKRSKAATQRSILRKSPHVQREYANRTGALPSNPVHPKQMEKLDRIRSQKPPQKGTTMPDGTVLPVGHQGAIPKNNPASAPDSAASASGATAAASSGKSEFKLDKNKILAGGAIGSAALGTYAYNKAPEGSKASETANAVVKGALVGASAGGVYGFLKARKEMGKAAALGALPAFASRAGSFLKRMGTSNAASAMRFRRGAAMGAAAGAAGGFASSDGSFTDRLGGAALGAVGGGALGSYMGYKMKPSFMKLSK